MSTDITNAEIQSVFDHCTRHEDDAVPLHIRFARALLSRQVPSPPAGDAGYKMVPHEPTREMLDAGHEQWSRMASYTDAWMAMWHAAPAAPADMVPRSRLAAMERELAEAAEKLAKVQKDASAEITRLMAAAPVAEPLTTQQIEALAEPLSFDAGPGQRHVNVYAIARAVEEHHGIKHHPATPEVAPK